MSLQIHRLGDTNTAGGSITSIPQGSVFANGLLVCVNGSIGTGHPPCPEPDIHCAGNWVTTGGGPTVFAEGIPVNKQGDADSCGHSRASGSFNVFLL